MKKPNIKIHSDGIQIGDVITNEDASNELVVLASSPNRSKFYCRDEGADEIVEVPLSDFSYAIIAEGY